MLALWLNSLAIIQKSTSSTPPPQVQERQVVAKQHRPLVNHQIVRLPARQVQQQVVQQPILQQQVVQPVGFVQQPAFSYGAAPVYGAGYGGAGYGGSFDVASSSVYGQQY